MSNSKKWIDRPAAIRDGEALDTEKLSAYLQEQLDDFTGEVAVEQFPSGFSNLTYLVKIGRDEYVLRRPPFGANIKSAHDMSREYTILSKLSPVYPKAPAPLLYCDDEAVIGAPFYMMDRVKGMILRGRMPTEMHPAPEEMSAIADAFVASFAELHRVDYNSAGLGDLGRPEGYVARQVAGWSARYEKAETDDIPTMQQTEKWLQENQPKDAGASLIHNDFKYDNIVLDPADRKSVIAILDWEMATLGDPLMDLGSTLGYWIDPADPPGIRQMALSPTLLPGNPTRAELLEKYAQASGRSVDNVVFYYAFGLFKIAVIVQQIYARYKKGYTKDKRFAGLIEGVRGLSMMAWQAIQKDRIDRLF